ncbi:MAG: hypothetical protein GY818_14415, partial [Planctomycetaceae bacterium]|nr:hypothetical protein [Planctomycetaceae bacterium]
MASQLFDPLGLVLPTTVLARLFIAELWDEKFGWDQPLPQAKVTTWQKLEHELNSVSRFTFSRWFDFDANQPIFLHGFADASKLVMGTAVYLSQGSKSVLLGSKSKLAPRGDKNRTIPQLELSAMLLCAQYTARLLEIVKSDFPDVQVRLWTDSEIALYWLTSSSRKLKQFVQNKVNAINSIFETADWGHTPSQENPADLVSRGCSAQSLRDSTLWEKGPTWLADQSNWPQWPKPQPTSTTVLAAAAEQQVNLESRGDISKI